MKPMESDGVAITPAMFGHLLRVLDVQEQAPPPAGAVVPHIFTPA
jgi:hypothetical protein